MTEGLFFLRPESSECGLFLRAAADNEPSVHDRSCPEGSSLLALKSVGSKSYIEPLQSFAKAQNLSESFVTLVKAMATALPSNSGRTIVTTILNKYLSAYRRSDLPRTLPD